MPNFSEAKTIRWIVFRTTLDSSLDLVNKMFNTSIKAELTYDDKEVPEDVTGEDNIDRN